MRYKSVYDEHALCLDSMVGSSGACFATYGTSDACQVLRGSANLE